MEEEDADGEADANMKERTKVGAVDRVQTPADLHNPGVTFSQFARLISACFENTLGLMPHGARQPHMLLVPLALMNLKGRRSSTTGRELLEACNTREASIHATELLNRRS